MFEANPEKVIAAYEARQAKEQEKETVSVTKSFAS